MTDLELAAYLDHGLNDSDRDRVEAHLAGCTECRAHVTTARKILDEEKRTPWSTGVWGGLAAAAILLILLIRPQLATRETQHASPVRGDLQSVPIVSYGPHGEVSAGSVRFVWGNLGAETVYKLVVTGQDGATLWSVSTRDTSIVLPVSLRLSAGKKYFWQVDALRSDGSTQSTRLEEFVVRP